jgi:chorismate synthase
MNSFGRLFRISIFGESHGKTVGITIDGCPAGLPISPDDFTADLSRRKSGAKGTTPRTEADTPQLISGTFKDKTTGAPLTILFENTNIKPKDYEGFTQHPRPGHADFVAQQKFGGFEDSTGGGHFSGRLTVALVAAGVIAKKIISPTTVDAKILEVGGRTDISNAIDEAVANHDSVGGLIECRATEMPVGLGEPFFDAAESLISHIIFAIPATKAIEFGSGFAAAKMKGSEHNDTIISADGKTKTNYAGGINGGISNGNDLIFRVAVKPTSSIGKSQNTFNFKNNTVEELKIKGRHDACIALRIPPVIEAATAIVLADLMLLEQKIRIRSAGKF